MIFWLELKLVFIKLKQDEVRAEPDFNVDIKKGSQVLSVECFFPDEDEEGEYNDDGYTGMIY